MKESKRIILNEILSSDEDRFVLHYSNLTSNISNIGSENYKIYSSSAYIFVLKHNVNISYNVSDYNVLGQIVYGSENINSDKMKIKLNKPGVYFVKISDENNSITRQLFVE